MCGKGWLIDRWLMLIEGQLYISNGRYIHTSSYVGLYRGSPLCSDTNGLCYCVNPIMMGSQYFSLAYRKKSEGEDGASKSKEGAEKYPQSRRLLSPKKHFA